MSKKKGVGLYLKALGLLKSQRSATGNNGFEKDKETVNADKGAEAENYLASPKPQADTRNIVYSKAIKNVKQKLSDPANAGNEKMVAATNPDTNVNMQTPIEPNRRYDRSGLISTKDTPTSVQMGFARPGESTFVVGAAYNPQTKQLNLKYRDGKIFPYFDVSPETVDTIVHGSESPHSIGQDVLKTVFYNSHKDDEIGSLFKGMKRKGMTLNEE